LAADARDDRTALDALRLDLFDCLHCCIAAGSAPGADYYSGSCNCSVQPAELHLHPELKLGWVCIVVSLRPAGSCCGSSPVEKKLKKDLTSRITWDIKGVLTRKTKGNKMSKAVNILEVLEKAQQSPASVSKRNKQAIVDAYGRALTMQKVLADFIKVNRQLMIDLSMSENANLLHGRDYSLHVTQKLGAKIDSQLVKEKLGEIAYHQCKVPTQYKQIQAMPLSESTVSRNKKATIDEVADFRISA